MKKFIFIILFINCSWATTWEFVDTSFICSNFKLEKKIIDDQTQQKVLLRYYSKINNTQVILNIFDYDKQFLYTKLYTEISYYCDLSISSLKQIQDCVFSETFFEDDSLNVYKDFQTCEEGNKLFNKLKLKLYRIFGANELSLFVEAKRICNRSNNEILDYYNSTNVNDFCVSENNYRPDDNVREALDKLLNGKIRKSDFFVFKKLYQQDVLLNDFIFKYSKLFDEKPSEILQQNFLNYISSKIDSKYNGKFDLIFEQYATHYVDLFINENSFNKNEYYSCIENKITLPQLSQPDHEIIDQLDKLCKGRCRNKCSKIDIYQHIHECAKKDIFENELSDILQNLNELNISYDRVEVSYLYNQCIKRTSNHKFCSIEIYKQKLSVDIHQTQKNIQAKYADFKLQGLNELSNKLGTCLIEQKKNDLESLKNCYRKTSNKSIDDYYRKELSLTNSTIVRFYQFCSDKGEHYDVCFKKLINNTIDQYLSNNEFDRAFKDLNSYYQEQIKDEPISILKSFSTFFSIIRPDYDKNDNASYCRRNMKFVDTIIFHHTATNYSYSVNSINRDHMDRGSANDPWLMIGYHYLIQNLNNDRDINNISVYQGRNIDVVGSHAGSDAFSENYPSQLLDQLKNEKLSCGKSPNFRPTDAVIRGNEVKANTNSIGIAFIGNFSERSISNPGGHPGPGKIHPSNNSLKKAADISCMLQKMYPNIKKIGYHRMYNTETGCPGWVTEKIDTIKKYAKELGCEF